MKGRIVKLGGIAVATAIGFATLVSVVQAQGDVIKDRQELMKSQGAAMKAINGILEANGALADIAPQAAKLEETSGKIADLFPAGSDQGDTKAKDLHEQAAMLSTAVAGGDMAAVKAQYEKVGGACGGCHKIYKAK